MVKIPIMYSTRLNQIKSEMIRCSGTKLKGYAARVRGMDGGEYTTRQYRARGASTLYWMGVKLEKPIPTVIPGVPTLKCKIYNHESTVL